MEKAYKPPSFEHQLSLNISIEEFKQRLRSLKYQGFQLEIRHNIYDDELFKITGFAGTVFEIEGVAQSLDDEQTQIRYNARCKTMGLSLVERTASVLALLLFNSLLFYLFYIFSSRPVIGGICAVLMLFSLPLSLRIIYLFVSQNLYQNENDEAAAALEKLHTRFLKTLNAENDLHALMQTMEKADKQRSQNPRIHES